MTCWQAPRLWGWGLQRGCPRPSPRRRPQADLAHPPNSLRHLPGYPLGEEMSQCTMRVNSTSVTIWACCSASGGLWPSFNGYASTGTELSASTGTEPQFHSGLRHGVSPAQRASKPLSSLSFQTAPGLTDRYRHLPQMCTVPSLAWEYSACAPRTLCHL